MVASVLATLSGQRADALKARTVVRIGTALDLHFGALFPYLGQWLAGSTAVPTQQAAQLLPAVVVVPARPTDTVPLIRVLAEQNIMLLHVVGVAGQLELQLLGERRASADNQQAEDAPRTLKAPHRCILDGGTADVPRRQQDRSGMGPSSVSAEPYDRFVRRRYKHSLGSSCGMHRRTS